MLHTLRFTFVFLGVFVTTNCAFGAPPNYRVESLDTGQFTAPSEHLPAGGDLFGVAFVSPNGRYVVAGVVGSDAHSATVPTFLAWLDRDTGTALLLTEFERPYPHGINNEGAIVLVATGTGEISRQMYYWSPSIGTIPFGSNSGPVRLISHGSGEGTPRILNNFGQVLVQTEGDEASVLWDPVADTRTTIDSDAVAPGYVQAISLNDLGQVVGGVAFPASDTGGVDVRPFIWDESNGLTLLFDLELISTFTSPFINFGRLAIANAINDAGVIAGETWDENVRLLGLHWDSASTVPTLRPCPEADPGEAPRKCAIWMLNDAGEFVGAEESDGLQAHFIWDGLEPYLLRNLLVDNPLPCQVFSIADDGTLAASCDGRPRLLIPIASGPQLEVAAPAPGDEVLAGFVHVTGTATDDVAIVRVTVNGSDAALGPSGNPADPNEVAFSFPLLLLPGERTIDITATDNDGNLATVSLTVLVIDPDTRGPVASDVLANPTPVPVATLIRLSAEIDDTDNGGSNIAAATFSIDGGPAVAMSAADGAFDSARESVMADIPGFAKAGVYEVCVIGTDLVGNAGTAACTFIAVFDPDGGFVTGGGWIDVPPGACRQNALLSGKANFGFVAKYRKQAVTPMGSTEFQFHAGGMNFHSLSYDWLVVSAFDGSARLDGTGTVNGDIAPNGTPYRFMLLAHDGSPDTFRIRIWWESAGGGSVLLDTGAMPLGGGSIVIHTRGN